MEIERRPCTRKQAEKIAAIYARYDLAELGQEIVKNYLEIDDSLDSSSTTQLDNAISISPKGVYIVVLPDGSAHS